MTVKELINKLLEAPMDNEVYLCYDKEHVDEYGIKCSGYNFNIDGVRKNGEIVFTDWRDKPKKSYQKAR